MDFGMALYSLSIDCGPPRILYVEDCGAEVVRGRN
jgi:hypothetical protein